jgi:hypothetical protein
VFGYPTLQPWVEGPWLQTRYVATGWHPGQLVVRVIVSQPKTRDGGGEVAASMLLWESEVVNGILRRGQSGGETLTLQGRVVVVRAGEQEEMVRGLEV